MWSDAKWVGIYHSGLHTTDSVMSFQDIKISRDIDKVRHSDLIHGMYLLNDLMLPCWHGWHIIEYVFNISVIVINI